MICLLCKKELFKKYSKKFCDNACSAKYSNSKRDQTFTKQLKEAICSCGQIQNVKVQTSTKNFHCDSCKVARYIKNGVGSKTTLLNLQIANGLHCIQCNKPLKSHQLKYCSRKCNHLFQFGTFEKQSSAGKNGGRKSAASRCVRSKNEIYFADLCKELFGEILTNQPIFDGWDADVIIPSLKIAVLWNGSWHYQQIGKAHKLSQVQARDKIKLSIIRNCGYKPYIIVDMGKANKSFVENEFCIFAQLVQRGLI